MKQRYLVFIKYGQHPKHNFEVITCFTCKGLAILDTQTGDTYCVKHNPRCMIIYTHASSAKQAGLYTHIRYPNFTVLASISDTELTSFNKDGKI